MGSCLSTGPRGSHPHDSLKGRSVSQQSTEALGSFDSLLCTDQPPARPPCHAAGYVDTPEPPAGTPTRTTPTRVAARQNGVKKGRELVARTTNETQDTLITNTAAAAALSTLPAKLAKWTDRRWWARVVVLNGSKAEVRLWMRGLEGAENGDNVDATGGGADGTIVKKSVMSGAPQAMLLFEFPAKYPAIPPKVYYKGPRYDFELDAELAINAPHHDTLRLWTRSSDLSEFVKVAVTDVLDGCAPLPRPLSTTLVWRGMERHAVGLLEYTASRQGVRGLFIRIDKLLFEADGPGAEEAHVLSRFDLINWSASLLEQMTPMLVPFESGEAISVLTQFIDLLARVNCSAGDDAVIGLRRLLYSLGRTWRQRRKAMQLGRLVHNVGTYSPDVWPWLLERGGGVPHNGTTGMKVQPAELIVNADLVNTAFLRFIAGACECGTLSGPWYWTPLGLVFRLLWYHRALLAARAVHNDQLGDVFAYGFDSKHRRHNATTFLPLKSLRTDAAGNRLSPGEDHSWVLTLILTPPAEKNAEESAWDITKPSSARHVYTLPVGVLTCT